MTFFATIIGKILRIFLKLIRPNGGSALPGKIIENIFPNYMKKMLRKPKYGVVVITGTNGKTTTTHIITDLLKKQGLRVFSNESGSNFTRGIVSELIKKASIFANPRADIAVLELDEAHGVHFVKKVPPNHCVLLNVMRDQLDRFGEIEKTSQMLAKIASATTDTLIVNTDDNYTERIAQEVEQKNSENIHKVNVVRFGVDSSLRSIFLNDDELHKNNQKVLNYLPKQSGHNMITLKSLNQNVVSYLINGHELSFTLKLKGIHNSLNLAPAIAVLREVMKNELDAKVMTSSINDVSSAFGRGESFEINGKIVDLVLVKNPAGFRMAMLSFEPSNSELMFAINDDYADGRDMSWLYDVEFNYGVGLVSGRRAYDMALRLEYGGIPVNHIIPNIKDAVNKLITSDSPSKRIYATYTAMLKIRSLLTKDKAFG